MKRVAAFGLAMAMLGWAASAQEAPDPAAVRDWLRLAELDGAPSIRKRLAAGQDPNVLGERGQAALHWALLNQSWQAVAALVDDPRTDLNLRNAQGETPLMLAALRGRLDWVQRLAAKGARVQDRADGPAWQPIHYAASAEAQGEALVAWLVEHGADLNAVSPNGKTPLMLAWAFGSVDAARLLMKQGARRELRDERGQTAWDHAVRAGRADLARRAGLSPEP